MERERERGEPTTPESVAPRARCTVRRNSSTSHAAGFPHTSMQAPCHNAAASPPETRQEVLQLEADHRHHLRHEGAARSRRWSARPRSGARRTQRAARGVEKSSESTCEIFHRVDVRCLLRGTQRAVARSARQAAMPSGGRMTLLMFLQDDGVLCSSARRTP